MITIQNQNFGVEIEVTATFSFDGSNFTCDIKPRNN